MRHILWSYLIVLSLLVGCGSPEPRPSTDSAAAPERPQATTGAATASASTPSPVASPTQPSVPTATFVATQTPAPAPTSTPTAAAPTPTVAAPTPTFQPAPKADAIVLSRGEKLLSVASDGSTSEIQVEGLETRTFDIAVSPDGSWIAGPVMPDAASGLALHNTETGEQQIIPQDGHVGHIRFAHDSSALVFTVDNDAGQDWRMYRLDLASREQRVLQQGSNMPMYVPLAWTPQGIIAVGGFAYGTDGGPEGIYLIDPATGDLRRIRSDKDPYVYAVPSPDGKQLAIVGGMVGLGIENPTFSLSIQDLASGETTLIEPEQPGGVSSLAWSPDSSKLLYKPHLAGSDPYAGPPTSYTIVGPAITEPMRLELPFAFMKLRTPLWRSDDALLLLVEDGAQERLYELPINDAGALREVASFAAASPQGSSAILYVDR
ncbi:MAG TPA: hypothetical protein VFZ66_11505 [Herpetosiphonaceae bacterium]